MLDTLFGSKTATLVLLFIQRQGEVYATQIAKDLRIPLNMVQKQLDRLTLGKLLVAKPIGRRKVYSWNRNYPLLGPLKRLLAQGNAIYKEDPADGTHLSIAERLALSESLTRQAFYLNPVKSFKPFAQTFESNAAYAHWRKKQKNPWFI